MLLGAHLSIAGGLHKALERARRYKFPTLAIFVRNQRQWHAPPLTDQAADTFRRVRRELGIGPVLAHGSYLVNLAGADLVRAKSILAVGDELDRCGRLGVEHYVFHPGSFGDATRAAGLRRLASALNQLIEQCPRPSIRILLETTAGARHIIGGTFEELAEVLGMLARPERFGVCLDTCHIFAAGYDIRTPETYAATMDHFDRSIGLPRLLAVHVNDSIGDFASHLDRHTHIGKGKIRLAGFANFVRDERLAAVPMLLETPKGFNRKGQDLDLLNARALRRLAAGPPARKRLVLLPVALPPPLHHNYAGSGKSSANRSGTKGARVIAGAGRLESVAAGLARAGREHALWELQTSRRILSSRKRIVLLAVALAPVFLPLLASAACADQLPSVLGGRKAYAPTMFAPEVLGVSILIGLLAGLITGCIGAGGGFVITPALMSVGVRGIMAVGTDMFHIFAKAIIGAALHKKMGNVSVKLAGVFVIGSALGVTGGAALNKAIYAISPVLSDAFISTMYAVLLGSLGAFALWDFLRLRKAVAAAPTSGAGDHERRLSRLVSGVQSVRLFPVLTFGARTDPSARRVWAGFVVIVGFVVGFLASIMGVGGGFITFPLFVYGLGIAEKTAVGTDVFQIVFTAGYAGIFGYAISGYVFYTMAMGLLLGSLVGIQIGAFTAKVVPPAYIRGFYALAILAGFFNRVFALPGKLANYDLITLSQATAGTLDAVGFVAFFATLGIFGLWVIAKFVTNLGRLRQA